MAGGWAYTIGVAAFMALAIDVRGQGTEDPGAKVAEEKCATCHSLPDEPDTGIAPSITDVANTQAVWTDILRKTHVMNRTQAAIWGLQRGVIGMAAAIAIALISYDWKNIELQAMSISNAYGACGDFLAGLGMSL
jgi:hypothetical protein